MKTIKHFMLPEQTNQLYKKEAISSISLTRDVAEKINELVDAYNEISNWNLAKQQEQDGAIRKGILYMKDNLINTLHDMIELLTAQGFFDDRVKVYTQELEKRIDNLLGSITEGSTSLDAELLDVRYGADGNLYNTAGESIRTQLNNLLEYIMNGSKYENLNIGEIENGYIDSNGELHDSFYTLRTKEFLPLLPYQCYLRNPKSDTVNIRIFQYSLDEVFEKEYLNSDVYRLDAHKLYKISFTPIKETVVRIGDIIKFPLYHFKPMLPLRPEYFGAVANDETFDNNPAFYSMFEYVKEIAPQVTYGNRTSYDLKNVTFEFSGVYYFASGVVLGDFINGVFNNLRMQNTSNSGFMLTLHYLKDCYFNNLYIDGNYKASGILFTEGYSNVSIKDSVICHFSYYGIRTSGGGGHELNIVGNKIFQTEYMYFDTLKTEIDYGCCLHITNTDTDNLVADNIFCYACGNHIVTIDSGSIMFNNNHIYNASHGEIYIHNTNGVYNGNFFDVVTLNDARGGNFYNGNTFMCTAEYTNFLLKFETANYYGRVSHFANNIFKYVNGYLYESIDEDSVKLSNNYEIVL